MRIWRGRDFNNKIDGEKGRIYIVKQHVACYYIQRVK
jgi:hypothetical protein